MTKTIFDKRRLETKSARALRRISRSGIEDAGFVHLEAANIIDERLAVTMRDFHHAALLFEGPFSRQVCDRIATLDRIRKHGNLIELSQPDNEIIDLEPESIDLAVSVLDLNRINDLPALFLQINHALKPDGLFMATLVVEGTLHELKESLLASELQQTGGAGLRVDNFPPLRQLGDLLQKTGFKLPVVDVESRTIRYAKFDSLVRDLRNAGAGNCHTGIIRPLTRQTACACANNFAERYSDQDGKLRTTINLAFLCGWKEDASQQKPLNPGSAKNRLKDFL